MKCPRLQCVELEISAWKLPSTLAVFRSLASELRLYCPNIIKVVFVHDYERTVVVYSNALYRIDDVTDTALENFWREI